MCVCVCVDVCGQIKCGTIVKVNPTVATSDHVSLSLNSVHDHVIVVINEITCAKGSPLFRPLTLRRPCVIVLEEGGGGLLGV
jgi:hypothetical protein